MYRGQKVYAYLVLKYLLRSIRTLHSLWRKTSYLTQSDLTLHEREVGIFADAWKAFSWKPTTWVHWVVAHSGYFAQTYKSLYLFTSIPTEKRHQTFKKDLRHSFMGWKFTKAHMNPKTLTHILDLEGLDKGLFLGDIVRPAKRRRL